jgi:hypothetical protein
MNITNFIIRLIHILNRPTLFVLTPLCSPSTPFANYAHIFADCENTVGENTDFFVKCAHNSDDYVNTPNGRTNIAINLADIPNMSSIDFCIPNLALL